MRLRTDVMVSHGCGHLFCLVRKRTLRIVFVQREVYQTRANLLAERAIIYAWYLEPLPSTPEMHWKMR